nr:uncharacterized protein LOC126548326 [Dermacentor andersoni]
MPALPQDDIKIVIRIRGGINIAKVGQLKVTKAICMAACIEPNERSEDTICPNLKQNIMVVSTPSEANAAKYLRIHSISIGEQTFETTACRTAPHETCKDVIRGVPLDETQDSINRKIVNPRNPLALAAKRIKETGTVIIAFDGFRVPNYVRYDNALIKCSLYRKQIAMCHVCGRLGHRADVCPSHDDAICKDCGLANPNADHVCTSIKCALCEGNHVKANKECMNRFQLPYVVRRRRVERRIAANASKSTTRSGPIAPSQHDLPPLKNAECCAINDNVTANADARLSGERGRSRSRNCGRLSSRSRERSRNPSQRSSSRIRFAPSPRVGGDDRLTSAQRVQQHQQERQEQQQQQQAASQPPSSLNRVSSSEGSRPNHVDELLSITTEGPELPDARDATDNDRRNFYRFYCKSGGKPRQM